MARSRCCSTARSSSERWSRRDDRPEDVLVANWWLGRSPVARGLSAHPRRMRMVRRGTRRTVGAASAGKPTAFFGPQRNTLIPSQFLQSKSNITDIIGRWGIGGIWAASRPVGLARAQRHSSRSSRRTVSATGAQAVPRLSADAARCAAARTRGPTPTVRDRRPPHRRRHHRLKRDRGRDAIYEASARRCASSATRASS